eukprot:6209789-Pleurochrysis_carterae.AAC.1
MATDTDVRGCWVSCIVALDWVHASVASHARAALRGSMFSEHGFLFHTARGGRPSALRKRTEQSSLLCRLARRVESSSGRRRDHCRKTMLSVQQPHIISMKIQGEDNAAKRTHSNRNKTPKIITADYVVQVSHLIVMILQGFGHQERCSSKSLNV